MEAEAALCYWFGVGTTTVGLWRKRLGVRPMNPGTQALYAAWRPIKLPNDQSVPINSAALRGQRLRNGLTYREIARRMGWSSMHTYGQLESGKRKGAMPSTLSRLARVFKCRAEELVKTRS